MKMLGIVVGFWVALAGSALLGQPVQKSSTEPRSGAALSSPGKGSSSDTTKKPSDDQSNKLELPKKPEVNLPDRNDLKDPAEIVQHMLDDIKEAQAKFLDEQKELQKKAKESSEDQRDKIRADIKEKREEFLRQQKEMREEFRKRVQEIKDQLKDHSDLVNEAKEQSKDRVKHRKGGRD